MQHPLDSTYPVDLEIKVLRRLGIRGAMIDVGANKGTYSMALEDTVDPRSLYLIEPLGDLARALGMQHPKASVYNLAFSDEAGTATIKIPTIEGRELQTRATLNDHREPMEDSYRTEVVNVATLDSFIECLEISSLGFLKIDVEGHELPLINGGATSIARLKPLVLIEIENRHHDFSIQRVFEKFSSLGFCGYFIHSRDLRLLKTSDFVPEEHQDLQKLVDRQFFDYLNNFFFVHQTQAADFERDVENILDEERRLM